MAVDSRQIYATVEIETIETILAMAQQEKRTFSNMVAILLEEAVNIREKKSKKVPA